MIMVSTPGSIIIRHERSEFVEMKGIHNYEQFLDIKLEECDFKSDSELRKAEPVIADQDTFPCNECGKT